MSIYFIINYARSGGTLLSRCLAAMPNTIVLSEVHLQKCAVNSIKTQLKKNYNISISSDDYLSAITETVNYCKKHNKYLIIRDWTFLDFTPHPINNNTTTNDFSSLNLLRTKFNVHVIAFIRNAIDVWISRKMPSQFFKSYLNYVKLLQTSSIPTFKYEQFCKNPHATLNMICNELQIPYSDAFQNFNQIKFIDGDFSSKRNRRFTEDSPIKENLRTVISRSSIKFLESQDEMIACNKAFDYGTSYAHKLRPSSYLEKLKIESRSRLKEIFRPNNQH